MALKSTIFKLTLHVADMDRHYYGEHNLTLARHPSETDLRMMIRTAVFALNASETLVFTKGISTDDEPDLWDKSLSGEIDHWFELGQPDEKRVRQACGKARHVSVYTYQPKSASVWRTQVSAKFGRLANIQVIDLQCDDYAQLTSLAERNMVLTATIQDGELNLSSVLGSVILRQDRWF